jgi:hypothetical protein
MSFRFRICFTVPGEGSLASDEEFISFVAKHIGCSMKLSSGNRGINIGKTDRFSVSGGPFETAESAQLAAEQVRVALLIRATRTRRGIDLGQQSLKRFGLFDSGKQYLADLLKVPIVKENHLGITVFQDNPMPQFFRMNVKGPRPCTHKFQRRGSRRLMSLDPRKRRKSGHPRRSEMCQVH